MASWSAVVSGRMVTFHGSPLHGYSICLAVFSATLLAPQQLDDMQAHVDARCDPAEQTTRPLSTKRRSV